LFCCCVLKVHSSVRNSILEGHVDYAVTAQSWPAFCYAGFRCNVEDVEEGLFRSSLLFKVGSRYSLLETNCC
jgi:hypothetical protein